MAIALVLAGVACIIAAIVGGGVKLRDVEFPTVQSVWRQVLLGGFGLVLALAGAVVKSEDSPAPAVNATSTEALAADTANDTKPSNEAVDANAVDANAVDTGATAGVASDPNATATATDASASENSGG
ncbi:hypothetical protein [Sphingomonas sp. RB1R13]|uniref:hypothetical protein n=1 Tax=Sphingomonas sp. RB1R13 TaxID=3096159 RepID=UPI002FCB95B4